MWQRKLNNEQLSALADLSFDLAKGAFAIAFLPTFTLSTNIFIGVINLIVAVIVGLAFTYYGLVLLWWKEVRQ